MAGQKGQNGPHYLKCSQCRKRRDENGYARKGDLVRTGRVGQVKRRRVWTRSWELLCVICGHKGWYTHRHAASKPLDTR